MLSGRRARLAQDQKNLSAGPVAQRLRSLCLSKLAQAIESSSSGCELQLVDCVGTAGSHDQLLRVSDPGSDMDSSSMASLAMHPGCWLWCHSHVLNSRPPRQRQGPILRFWIALLSPQQQAAQMPRLVCQASRGRTMCRGTWRRCFHQKRPDSTVTPIAASHCSAARCDEART